MKLIVHAHHLPLTFAIKTYTLQKFSRLTKYSNKLERIRLNLMYRQGCSSAATDFSFSGTHCYLKAHHRDLYTALNTLSVKVSQKIKDLKDQLPSRHRARQSLKR